MKFYSPLALVLFAFSTVSFAAAVEGKSRSIVIFREGNLASQIAAAERIGAKLDRKLEIIHGASFTADQAAIDRIAKLKEVVSVSAEGMVKKTMDDVTPAVGAETAFNSGWTGKGITIAVVDSGITVNADLTDAKGASRLLYQESFSPETVTVDVYGHGSHIAGIAGGRGANSTGAGFTRNFRGIAPEARFVSLIALDRNGVGREVDVIVAIAKAILLKSKYNIRILNLSLGKAVTSSYKVDPLCLAVEAAWKAGIVVVVSAGNEGRNDAFKTGGYGTISSPANDPYVITVGALKTMGTPTRSDDVLASYSSKGPSLLDRIVKPDLVAPGNKIVSVLSQDGRFRNSNPESVVPENYYKSGGNPNGDKYFWMSGTSMAAPVVSGAAALLLQKTPTLTPDQVKYRLMKSASKNFPLFSSSTDPVTNKTYTIRHDLFSVGAGYLDLNAALANTELPTKRALSPTAIYNSSTKKVSITNTSSTSVVWGDTTAAWNVVWGSNIVAGTSIVWGDSVVWGDSTTAGFNIVWGDSVVWGDSIVWGDRTPKSESDSLLLKGDK